MVTVLVFHNQTINYDSVTFPNDRKIVELLAAVGLKKSWYLPMDS